MKQLFLVLLLTHFFAAAEDLKDIRAQGKEMLQIVRKDVEKHYYDAHSAEST